MATTLSSRVGGPADARCATRGAVTRSWSACAGSRSPRPALVLVVAAIAFINAMSGPSNTALGVRSVEWLRDNGAAGIVAQVESWYYTLTAPSKGGPALRSLPKVGDAAAGTSSTPATTTPAASTGTRTGTSAKTGHARAGRRAGPARADAQAITPRTRSPSPRGRGACCR